MDGVSGKLKAEKEMVVEETDLAKVCLKEWMEHEDWQETCLVHLLEQRWKV